MKPKHFRVTRDPWSPSRRPRAHLLCRQQHAGAQARCRARACSRPRRQCREGRHHRAAAGRQDADPRQRDKAAGRSRSAAAIPARPTSVRALMVKLAEADLVEAKTRRPDRYGLIELEEPAGARTPSRARCACSTPRAACSPRRWSARSAATRSAPARPAPTCASRATPRPGSPTPTSTCRPTCRTGSRRPCSTLDSSQGRQRHRRDPRRAAARRSSAMPPTRSSPSSASRRARS